MRASRLFAAMVGLSLLAGCAASKVDPKARVDLHGRLLRPDSTAAAGVSVGLYRTPDLGELLTIGFTAGAALLTCLSDRGLPVCRSVRHRTTDAAGRYHYVLRGTDVRGSFGTASSFSLSAALPATDGEVTGPGVTTSFKIQRTDLRLPDLTFWRPDRLSATAHGRGQVAVRWSRPAAPRGPRPARYTVRFTRGDAVVWSQPARDGKRVDARALEDVSPDLQVEATTSRRGPDTRFRTTYLSQRVRTRLAGAAPPSRHAACAVAGADGPVPVAPCTLTDGRFDTRFPLQRCPTPSPRGVPPGQDASPATGRTATPKPCRANTWLYLDLGAPRTVRTLFAHGLRMSGGLIIDTSDDATTWTRQARVIAPSMFTKVTLAHPVTARYVRIRTARDAGYLTGLTELSVWPTP